MTSVIVTLLGTSLFGLACSVPIILPTDTPVDYQTLKTQGFTRYFNYAGSLNATGDVQVTVTPLYATLLDINMVGGDALCPENRASSALPPNGCSIFVSTGNCSVFDPLQQAHFATTDTIINPWRKANYGYGANASLVQMKVLAGTNLEQSQLADTVVIAHDSSGAPFACGKLVDTTATLAAVPGYSGNVEFQSGSVGVTTQLRNVAVLSNAAEGLHGVDDKCTTDFASTPNQLRKKDTTTPNACGIHIHEAKSCDATQNPHYWDHAEGSHDPWVDVRYAIDGAAFNGTPNSAEVKAKQPVFTGEPITNLSGRSVILHDSNGLRIACSTLMPFGEPQASTWTTTTTGPAASSSIPWWGILLIALGALAVIGGLAALFLCGGKKKRSMKKKSSKKRGYQVEEPAALLSPPEPQPSFQAVPQYATPVYTTVHHAVPTASMYAAPVAMAAPVTYTAPPQYAAPTATYSAPIPTYAQPVATYAQQAVAAYAPGTVAAYAPGGSVMMLQ